MVTVLNCIAYEINISIQCQILIFEKYIPNLIPEVVLKISLHYTNRET